MATPTAAAGTGNEARRRDAAGRREVLRVLVCGSPESGKSTLLARVIEDARLVADDRVEDSASPDRAAEMAGGGRQFVLLLEGRGAGRERSAASDLAYRVFATPKRRFVAAEIPGHAQDTRNTVVGASAADLAVMVIDARRGLLTETRRDSVIAALMGVRSVILAVNKMDLVDFEKSVFDAIEADNRAFADKLGIRRVTAIPVAAATGENVAARSGAMDWCRGPAFLEALETAEPGGGAAGAPFRFPIDGQSRADRHIRGYAGTVAAGAVSTGATVKVLPSERETTVTEILTAEGPRGEARTGEAATLVLGDDIDIGRGDVIAAPEDPPQVTDQFAAHVVWFDRSPLIPERRYILKLATAETGAAVTELKHRVNVDTLEHVAAKSLSAGDVGFCNLALDKAIAVDPYAKNPALGGFVLIDRFTGATAGAGLITFSLRRATNVQWQEVEIHKGELAALKTQTPAIVWFTGLSGAGKSTIANIVQKRLHAEGRHTYLIDGDNVRHGLNRDLGFTETDRVENIRRVAEVAKLFVDSGLIVLVSLISPFRQERLMARELVEDGEFIEVFVDTPLAVCEERDPKGLYRKARAGDLVNFTGIDSPYETPESPEIKVEGQGDAEAAAQRILDYLEEKGYLGRR